LQSEAPPSAFTPPIFPSRELAFSAPCSMVRLRDVLRSCFSRASNRTARRMTLRPRPCSLPRRASPSTHPAPSVAPFDPGSRTIRPGQLSHLTPSGTLTHAVKQPHSRRQTATLTPSLTPSDAVKQIHSRRQSLHLTPSVAPSDAVGHPTCCRHSPSTSCTCPAPAPRWSLLTACDFTAEHRD
jgi:hypothetical protein